MKKCKNCGREEFGYGSILNEDGYCSTCAIRHNAEKVKELKKQIEHLQIQLKEANEIIANFRTYDFTINDENAEEYQVKYGIAGEKIYTNKKPPKEFELWRKKITKSLEKKLKKGV